MLEIHMIPVTNGESTLLRLRAGAEEVNILFDAGLSGKECLGYLTRLGVRRLDVIIASHFDWDHVGGMKTVRDSIEVGEYWTGDIRPFEEYCRQPEPSMYVLRCLITADAPLRSRNGRNRLVWDGIRKSLAGGLLTLDVIAPPYSLWERLRQPGVASGLLEPSQAQAYRDRLLHYPESVEIEEIREERRTEGESDWEIVEPIGSEYDPPQGPITEEDIKEEYEPDMARFLSSATSPWNDMSLVVKLAYQSSVGPLSILFTGDLVDWSYVYAYHPSDAKCDLLKVPHHCSDIYVDRKEVMDWLEGEMLFLIEGFLRHGPDWLDRQLCVRSGSRYYRLWYRWWREFGPPFPYPFAWTPAPAAIPTDVVQWLSPTEAFYFPLDLGRVHLPAWTKREQIRNKVRALYCTREPRMPSGGSALGVSCGSHSGCSMRSTPLVLRWE